MTSPRFLGFVTFTRKVGLGRTTTLAPATPHDIREHKRSVDDVKLAAGTILNMNEQAEERAEEPNDSGEVFGAVRVSLRWILFGAAFTHIYTTPIIYGSKTTSLGG